MPFLREIQETILLRGNKVACGAVAPLAIGERRGRCGCDRGEETCGGETAAPRLASTRRQAAEVALQGRIDEMVQHDRKDEHNHEGQSHVMNHTGRVRNFAEVARGRDSAVMAQDVVMVR